MEPLLLDLAWSLFSYVAFTGAGGIVGYFFARKQTEHEIGYGRRVETVESIQLSIVSLVEEFRAALEYVSGSGPFDGAPAKKIDRAVDDLERYYLQQEIWLNRETFSLLEALTAASRVRQRELASLPLYYDDPDFEREHERVREDLDLWLREDLLRARERLAEAFRGLIGVGRWRRGLSY